MAAAVWMGGSIFYLIVLQPAMRKDSSQSLVFTKSVAAHFRTVVDISIVLLIVSGAVIAFNRLTGGTVGVSYVTILGVKVALSVWMFLLVQMERRSADVMSAYDTGLINSSNGSFIQTTFKNLLSGYNGVTVIGIAVFLLSDVLKILFENALKLD